jgi:hypothetical protein
MDNLMAMVNRSTTRSAGVDDHVGVNGFGVAPVGLGSTTGATVAAGVSRPIRLSVGGLTSDGWPAGSYDRRPQRGLTSAGYRKHYETH